MVGTVQDDRQWDHNFTFETALRQVEQPRSDWSLQTLGLQIGLQVDYAAEVPPVESPEELYALQNDLAELDDRVAVAPVEQTDGGILAWHFGAANGISGVLQTVSCSHPNLSLDL
jgi:hypothetical protein